MAGNNKIGELKECGTCVYFHEPDMVGFKECCFPWFDYTEEEAMLMNCQNEREGKQDD